MCFHLPWLCLRWENDCPSRCQPPYLLVQVFSGTVPFPDLTHPAAFTTIVNGGRPDRPPHSSLTDSLWELVQKCWNGTVGERPEMGDVVKELKGMSAYFFFRDKLPAYALINISEGRLCIR